MKDKKDNIESMTEKDLDRIIADNKEWRRLLWNKMDLLDSHIKQSDAEITKQISEFKLDYMKKITTLEIKVALFGAIFGFSSGAIASIAVAFIKN
jgi:hypothetical protein